MNSRQWEFGTVVKANQLIDCHGLEDAYAMIASVLDRWYHRQSQNDRRGHYAISLQPGVHASNVILADTEMLTLEQIQNTQSDRQFHGHRSLRTVLCLLLCIYLRAQMQFSSITRP